MTTGINYTGGKFATGVNDTYHFFLVLVTGGKLPPVSTTPAANLPPLLGKLQAKIRTTGDLVYNNNFFSTDSGVCTIKKTILLILPIFLLFVAYDLLEGINNKWFCNVAPMFKSHAVRDRST